jgi:hypothetical protein
VLISLPFNRAVGFVGPGPASLMTVFAGADYYLWQSKYYYFVGCMKNWMKMNRAEKSSCGGAANE